MPVSDAALGNGDEFGVYWPYGREKCEPMVCETVHDSWSLRISFNSVGEFVSWLESNDWEWDEIDETQIDHPAVKLKEAKRLIRDQPDYAVALLQNLCLDFSEISEYWYTLASQQKRFGDSVGATESAIRAFASNWAFGMPHTSVLRFMQSSESDDPLVQRSCELTMDFGGVFENGNYRVLAECVEAYVERDEPVLALLLDQNVALMMSMETSSFRERNDFSLDRWRDQHRQLCEQHLGDDRTEYHTEVKGC